MRYGGKTLAMSEDVVYVVDVEALLSEMRSHQFDWEVAINDVFNSAMGTINLSLVVSS
jgi:hypothetical protein